MRLDRQQDCMVRGSRAAPPTRPGRSLLGLRIHVTMLLAIEWCRPPETIPQSLRFM